MVAAERSPQPLTVDERGKGGNPSHSVGMRGESDTQIRIVAVTIDWQDAEALKTVIETHPDVEVILNEVGQSGCSSPF